MGTVEYDEPDWTGYIEVREELERRIERMKYYDDVPTKEELIELFEEWSKKL